MKFVCCAAAAMLAIAATPAPAGWSVAYGPAQNLEKLDVALIDSAEKRIDFAAFILTDVAVIDALSAAAMRGVTVRIYRDPGQAEPTGFVGERLRMLLALPGVTTRTKRGHDLMHLKSYAVDGRVLRGGAANFSASGLKRQDNDRWETDDAAAIRDFERQFEAMWAR